MKFDVKDKFYLNGKEFKILSGAIHYFRVHPNDWYHSLYNLKALGFNTVETYIPWNMHEQNKGEFNFEGILDIEKFIKLAGSLGLYAIIRPSPFICAEWEFGGMPAWLLNKNIRIRSSDPKFIKEVDDYYSKLLPILTPYLLENGGNILMIQIENEYGSYGEDKLYLKEIKRLLRKYGITCPLFTSDGPWQGTLEAGSMVDDDVLITGNFGSKADFNFGQMKKFFNKHDKDYPLMCMEFWDGWFNRWNEPIIKRDAKELAQSVLEVLKSGSINLYMFHGGTNFGFMNGCSARGNIDLPQVTSYDYDAILNEEGNPTPKYYAIQDMMYEHFQEYEKKAPLIKACQEIKDIKLSEKVSLFETLDSFSAPVQSLYPMSFEDLDHYYGYILYQTNSKWDACSERLRVIDARDRIQLFVDNKHIKTQYQTEIGEDIFVDGEIDKEHDIKILVENMGRVNYGHKLLSVTQRKGIKTGVCKDLHFILNWNQYTLDFKKLDNIDFSKKWHEKTPAFYKYEVDLNETLKTHIDMSEFGKGVVFVNGYNIGRFYNVGPTLSLYVPGGLLKIGKNEIIVFETEGIYSNKLNFLKQPKFKKVEGENL